MPLGHSAPQETQERYTAFAGMAGRMSQQRAGCGACRGQATNGGWDAGRRSTDFGVSRFCWCWRVTEVSQCRAPALSGSALFFGLSGFLITALLLEEYERNGAISLRA